MSGTQHDGTLPDERSAPSPASADTDEVGGHAVPAEQADGAPWDEAWLPTWVHPEPGDVPTGPGTARPEPAAELPATPLSAWEVEAAASAALIAELDSAADPPLALTPPYMTPPSSVPVLSSLALHRGGPADHRADADLAAPAGPGWSSAPVELPRPTGTVVPAVDVRPAATVPTPRTGRDDEPGELAEPAVQRRAAQQQAAEQLAAEQRAAAQRAAERRVAEQRMAEQLAAEELAAERLAAEQSAAARLAAEQLAAWSAVVPEHAAAPASVVGPPARRSRRARVLLPLAVLGVAGVIAGFVVPGQGGTERPAEAAAQQDSVPSAAVPAPVRAPVTTGPLSAAPTTAEVQVQVPTPAATSSQPTTARGRTAGVARPASRAQSPVRASGAPVPGVRRPAEVAPVPQPSPTPLPSDAGGVPGALTGAPAPVAAPTTGTPCTTVAAAAVETADASAAAGTATAGPADPTGATCPPATDAPASGGPAPDGPASDVPASDVPGPAADDPATPAPGTPADPGVPATPGPLPTPTRSDPEGSAPLTSAPASSLAGTVTQLLPSGATPSR